MIENLKYRKIPSLIYEKFIQDPIYGYIGLTPLEHDIIQLPVFNRLHHIHHLGLAYMVYPAAKTTRFEHSLGVMHLATKMITQILLTSGSEIIEEVFGFNPNKDEFIKKALEVIQKVRLVALLHDIGHGPFSHVTESFLRRALREEERDEAKELFRAKKDEDIPVHEYFAYKMITDQDSPIRETIDRYGVDPKEVAKLITKDKADPEAMVLRQIISSQLDADRLDYLVRDSYITGAKYGIVDANRIIINLKLIKCRSKYRIAVHKRALRAIEHYLDSRYRMYISVYFHHLVSAFEAILKHAINTLINDEKININIKDFHYKAFLEGKTDDNYILCKLKDAIYRDSSGKYKLFKCLLDRRYAPVSLFKRAEDFRKFKNDLFKKIKKKFTEVDKKYFNYILTKEVLSTYREGRMVGRNCKNIDVSLYFIPYTRHIRYYKIGEESIVIWYDNKCIGLTDASSYAKALNKVITYIGGENIIKVAYIVPDVDKKNAKKYLKVAKECFFKKIKEDVENKLQT